MIRAVIRELQKIFFVVTREDGEDGRSYSAAFRTCQDNI